MIGFPAEGKDCRYGNQMILFCDPSPSTLVSLPNSLQPRCGVGKLPAALSRECSDIGPLGFPSSGSESLGRG